MDGDWETDNRATGRLSACRTSTEMAPDGINPETMLGLVVMRAAWPWFLNVTGSLYLVPTADAMMRQNRETIPDVPLD